MSWRNQGITGSNNIPLGNRRKFGGDRNGDRNGDSATPTDDGGYNPSEPFTGMSEVGSKRGRSPVQGLSYLPTPHDFARY